MKIALIGPFPPYRSGVARHTGALADALAQHGDIIRVSFSRQYPSLLFPGESDRDENAAPADADFCIDSINPLTWRKAARRIKAARPDIAIIPAWTFFTAPALSYIARSLRRAGVRVIAMVHNAADHETKGWKSWLLAQQIRQADAAVAHNQALARAVGGIAERLPVAVAPHPIFDYPTAKTTLPRRATLELLFFGLIRPYKGVDLLIDAVARCRDVDVNLSIVGEIWGDPKALREKVAASGLEDRIELVSHYVSDEDAANYFARADIVVLPYTHVTGTGVAPVAFHYGKPVIASDLEGFRDLVRPQETGWLFPASDADALAGVIRERALKNDAPSLAPHIAAERARLSWPAFAGNVMKGAAAARRTETSNEAAGSTMANRNTAPHCALEPMGASQSTAGAPKISVVMPAYNAERYVGAAIDSILAQTLGDFEFIIIDDCSTDATPRILAEAAAGDSRLRILHNETNQGVTKSLNRGLKEARGCYIARMDADDVSLPERFEKQAAFLDANPDHVFVAASYRMIDAEDRFIKTNIEATESWECAWMSMFRTPVNHPTMMIKRSVLSENGISYETGYEHAEDLRFIQHLLEWGKGCALADILFNYRMHASNVSSQNVILQRDAIRRAAALNVKTIFPAIKSERIDALFDYLYGDAGDVAAAVNTLKTIQSLFEENNKLTPEARKRMHALSIRWLSAAALRRGVQRNPRHMMEFLWAVRDYFGDAPREAIDYLKRRTTARKAA